jgi:hypothetical protein
LTVDEELNLLEESVRRLKIEYDVYFGGGSKKPPADTDWRVQTLIKKYSDGHKMNFPQRFKYNTIVQRYALFSDLWRQKLKIKEEGYRRPQDAALGIAGMRVEEEHQAAAELAGETVDQGGDKPFIANVSNPAEEQERVQALYQAMVNAKQKAGEAAPPGDINSFKQFVQKKTEQLRKDYGCHAVEYSVELENGQVKLKAKAKV